MAFGTVFIHIIIRICTLSLGIVLLVPELFAYGRWAGGLFKSAPFLILLILPMTLLVSILL